VVLFFRPWRRSPKDKPDNTQRAIFRWFEIHINRQRWVDARCLNGPFFSRLSPWWQISDPCLRPPVAGGGAGLCWPFVVLTLFRGRAPLDERFVCGSRRRERTRPLPKSPKDLPAAVPAPHFVGPRLPRWSGFSYPPSLFLVGGLRGHSEKTGAGTSIYIRASPTRAGKGFLRSAQDHGSCYKRRGESARGPQAHSRRPMGSQRSHCDRRNSPQWPARPNWFDDTRFLLFFFWVVGGRG